MDIQQTVLRCKKEIEDQDDKLLEEYSMLNSLKKYRKQVRALSLHVTSRISSHVLFDPAQANLFDPAMALQWGQLKPKKWPNLSMHLHTHPSQIDENPSTQYYSSDHDSTIPLSSRSIGSIGTSSVALLASALSAALVPPQFQQESDTSAAPTQHQNDDFHIEMEKQEIRARVINDYWSALGEGSTNKVVAGLTELKFDDDGNMIAPVEVEEEVHSRASTADDASIESKDSLAISLSTEASSTIPITKTKTYELWMKSKAISKRANTSRRSAIQYGTGDTDADTGQIRALVTENNEDGDNKDGNVNQEVADDDSSALWTESVLDDASEAIQQQYFSGLYLKPPVRPGSVDADTLVWMPQVNCKTSVSFAPAEHPDRPTLLAELEEEKERSEEEDKKLAMEMKKIHETTQGRFNKARRQNVANADQIIADPFIAYGLSVSKLKLQKMQRNLEEIAEKAALEAAEAGKYVVVSH